MKHQGNESFYSELHRWVKKELGKPDTCENCGRTGLVGTEIHWANISGEYIRDGSDWARLCSVCHGLFDKPTMTVCQRGHAFVGDNIYVHPSGGRMCKECKRITRKLWRQNEKRVRSSAFNKSAEQSADG